LHALIGYRGGVNTTGAGVVISWVVYKDKLKKSLLTLDAFSATSERPSSIPGASSTR
jgi:hypothetical protein